MPVRFASAATATASPVVDTSTWGCATCAHVNERSAATCSMCESSRGATDPRLTPREDDMREREEMRSDASARSSESDASELEARASHRTMHRAVSKLVNRLAAPATTVLNGALVGAFAVAGASVGAVAGAVAARTASRGVSILRGAGVGAVAGAAVSVEALDLARLCLSGYSVAGAMERRESRLALRAWDAEGIVAAARGDDADAAAAASAGSRLRGVRDDARRDGDSGGRETQRRARGRRFAASTFSVASSSASNVSGVERRAESPARDARAGAGARPLAIRARRAEVDGRAREMERALARGDVERILHELFRGGSEPESQSRDDAVDDAVSSRTLSDAEADPLADASDAAFDARGRARRVARAEWRGFGSDDGSGSGDAGSRSDGSESDVAGERDTSGFANANWTSTSSLHRALEAMFTASRLDTMTYEELLERFGPGNPGTPVAPAEAVRAIPTRRLTRSDLRGGKERTGRSAGERRVDDFDSDAADAASSETSSETCFEDFEEGVPRRDAAASPRASERCCVCLEAWTVGAETKSLRGCRHTFHAACIDRWLTEERNACPVCRRAGVDVRCEGASLEGNEFAK